MFIATISTLIFALLAWMCVLYLFLKKNRLQEGIKEFLACLIRCVGLALICVPVLFFARFTVIGEETIYYFLLFAGSFMALLWAGTAYEAVSRGQKKLPKDDTLLDNEFI